MAKKKTSGLEDIPPFLSKPRWKEPLLWIALATAAMWICLLVYLFA